MGDWNDVTSCLGPCSFGESASKGRRVLFQRGVSIQRESVSPFPCEQNDRHVKNITFPQLHWRAVITPTPRVETYHGELWYYEDIAVYRKVLLYVAGIFGWMAKYILAKSSHNQTADGRHIEIVPEFASVWFKFTTCKLQLAEIAWSFLFELFLFFCRRKRKGPIQSDSKYKLNTIMPVWDPIGE